MITIPLIVFILMGGFTVVGIYHFILVGYYLVTGKR